MSEKTTGTVLTAAGEIEQISTTILTSEEAQILRAYKKFLQTHGIVEVNYCLECGAGSREDGMKVFVTNGQILFQCRHRMLFYQGLAF